MRSSASEYVYVRVGYFNFRSGGINWIDGVLKTCTETHKKTVVNDVAEFRDRIRGKLFLADESRSVFAMLKNLIPVSSPQPDNLFSASR